VPGYQALTKENVRRRQGVLQTHLLLFVAFAYVEFQVAVSCLPLKAALSFSQMEVGRLLHHTRPSGSHF
jgi:hypothetical protein